MLGVIVSIEASLMRALEPWVCPIEVVLDTGRISRPVKGWANQSVKLCVTMWADGPKNWKDAFSGKN